MRFVLWMVLLIGLFGLSAGCGGDKPAPNLKAQLDAALAISDSPGRDSALATVAENAAAASDVDIVNQAAAKISDQPKRDKTRADAALKLASNGKSAEAVEVAKKISDQPLRDRTLSKLAK